MSVLDITYNPAKASSTSKKIWCDEDRHQFYENFPDFNDWIESDEGESIRVENGIDDLLQPSKALYAGDPESYKQAFKVYRDERLKQALGEEFIVNNFGDKHWFERNIQHFEQLENCLIDGSVVPFVGAGLSVESGFPSWKEHLKQQGRTAGINAAHVNDLLDNGHYETVIEEIEAIRGRDTFIQEIKDAFSKTGTITETTWRLTDLFNDTIITTNYDRILEQAYDTGKENNIQLLDSTNILDKADINKITIIKLHGDIKQPARCILSKNQYNDAYGNGTLDLNKDIPRVLSYHYRTSSLLFLGCSLNRDRTMEVFQAVKDTLGDTDRPPHFSLESMPADEVELANRNAYLLSFGITPIWFPKSSYEFVEQILRLAKNEMRYRGNVPRIKKVVEEPIAVPVLTEEIQSTGIKKAWNSVIKFLGI
ncbi:SIR2 family NAD-dependent protein deacylase [Flavobacterium sp.]|uniref:SIR2 family NAD-dependent protein deacylase n=1 Tax=Flavobacterium sp. TaxID=239 RepID=UPI003BD37CF3